MEHDLIEENNINKKKDNIFYSSNHTLFLKDISHDAIPKEDDDEYYKIIEPYVIYNLYLGSFMEKNRGLHELFYALRQANEDDYLDIRIYSHGGSIDEGKQLQNIINEFFQNRTRTILDPLGHSMGALSFCMGHERIVYENSTLMFHDYSHVVGGKGGEIESQVVHNSQSVRDFFYSTVVPHGYMTEEEFERMLDGKDFWMDAVEMCSRNIATHIMISGVKIKSELYLMFIDDKIDYDEMMSGIINNIPKKNKPKKVAKKKVSKKKNVKKD